VQFEISGGSITDQVVGTATPTIVGYLYGLNTTAFPNGTYTIQSVATDDAGLTTTSAPVTVTIANPPSTSVLLPTAKATVEGGTWLDASASSANGIASVQFEISGGSITDQVVGTATPTIVGYLYGLNTTVFPNGIYTMQSVATDDLGVSTTSTPVSFTIANSP